MNIKEQSSDAGEAADGLPLGNTIYLIHNNDSNDDTQVQYINIGDKIKVTYRGHQDLVTVKGARADSRCPATTGDRACHRDIRGQGGW